jgi:8-oxo-dGTP pyrophosphatase MutT (NUDIX family)
MVRRSSSSVFVGGAYVFPGGAIDEVDTSDTARTLFGDGASAPWLSAAVRETAEEAGLVVPTGGGHIPRGLRGAELLEALAADGYLFDESRLAYFSNWVTPKGQPRRFDTRFFVTDAPKGTHAFPDAVEVTEAIWVTPHEALENRTNRHWMLVPPTIATLELLTGFDTSDEVLAYARRQTSITRIEPRIGRGDDGSPSLLMPGDPGYEEADA